MRTRTEQKAMTVRMTLHMFVVMSQAIEGMVKFKLKFCKKV